MSFPSGGSGLQNKLCCPHVSGLPFMCAGPTIAMPVCRNALLFLLLLLLLFKCYTLHVMSRLMRHLAAASMLVVCDVICGRLVA